jgi:hypothetical protein
MDKPAVKTKTCLKYLRRFARGLIGIVKAQWCSDAKKDALLRQCYSCTVLPTVRFSVFIVVAGKVPMAVLPCLDGESRGD